MTEDELDGEIVDAAFKVHSALGPGLLESAYESCLAHEFASRGLRAERQVERPVVYGDHIVDAGYRIDFLVEAQIIIELKAVETLLPIHQAQLITYLKLSDLRLGYLINFNVRLIKNGIQRIKL